MRPYYLIIAVAILLTAAVLRITQLHDYPPGPHYDEAANVLITRSITFDGANLFPIANSYQGRESLYFYLNAPLFRFIADDIFVMRVASVFSNLLTIAASMALGRAMFRSESGLVIGLAVGVLMTLSFHQLLMSRQAFRAVTLPLMQALGLLFLWRGLRQERWLWLVMGGVFSAGALYTYMASRLFPVWLLLAGLLLLWLERARFRRRLRQGIVFFGALAIATLPMGLYALQNPDIFFQRLTEVSGDSGEAVTLAESIRLHAEMFFIRGDFGNLRYNIPGRPYFTWLEGVLLLVGLGVAAWRLVSGVNKPDAAGRVPTMNQRFVGTSNGASAPDSKNTPLQRTAYFLLLLAPLMVIPSVISVGGLPPSHMRSLGMVPLIFIVVAVGFEAVLPRRLYRYLPVGIVALTVIGGVLLADTYFGWAKRADLFYQADGDLAEAVRWLPAHTEGDTPVYIASYHRAHPTVLAGTDHAINWLGTDSLFLPPDGQEGIVIFAHSTPPPPDWAALLADYRLTDVPAGPDGDPAFWAYRIPPDVTLDGFQAPEQVLSNPFLRYAGGAQTAIPAGSVGEVTLAWDVLQTPPYARLRPVLDVTTPDGVLLSSSDLFLLGTDHWTPGETALYRMPVHVPPGTPPGDYPLSVTWIDRDSETYLSYAREDRAHAGISAQLGTVQISKPDVFPTPEAIAIPVRQQADVAPGVRLLGHSVIPDRLRAGELFRVTLYWQALPGDSRSDNLILNAMLGNESIWEGDFDYEPSNWDDGEIVAQHLRWRIPHGQPAGTYPLALDVGGTLVSLGDVPLETVARVFTPPPVEKVVAASFGDALALYGYTIDVADEIRLSLVWTTVTPVVEDYTIFVHLVDSSGQLLAQRDNIPDLPTSLWAAGEFIVTQYYFETVPAGEWSIRVGLYQPANGVRLSTMNANNKLNDYIEID